MGPKVVGDSHPARGRLVAYIECTIWLGRKELKVETTQNMLLLCRKSINMITAMPKTGGACLQKNEKY